MEEKEIFFREFISVPSFPIPLPLCPLSFQNLSEPLFLRRLLFSAETASKNLATFGRATLVERPKETYSPPRHTRRSVPRPSPHSAEIEKGRRISEFYFLGKGAASDPFFLLLYPTLSPAFVERRCRGGGGVTKKARLSFLKRG